MVAEAFIPNPDNLPQVDHINTIKTDNRAENLEWVTAQQNTQRAHDLGLCNGRIGEKSPYHKYTETEIRRVCELLEDGSYDFDEISNITGLDKNVFRRVLHRINWTHISKEYDFSKMICSPIHKRHQKQKKHTNLHNCIDRAIDSGMERNNIIAVLTSHGLPRDVARGLYDARKKKVDNHESIVQCTVYIDEGIDIFKKRSTTIDNHYDNTEPVYVTCDDV